MKKSKHLHSTVNALFGVFLVISSVTFSACSDGGTNPRGDTKPSISAINPTKGAIGSNVSLQGSNFSTVETENSVKFGGTESTINSASENELKVTVPEGINAGIAYTVTATVAGETATAPTNFTVTGGTSPLADTADVVPQDGILETVTWNLLKFQGDPGNKINNDIKIADSLNADLFAFEEVLGEDAIDSLANRMKEYAAIYDKTSNQGNAFVYNTNAIEPISSGKISMGQTSNPWAGRLPFYFSFNYKPGNGGAPVEIYAVVIHAKAGGGQDDYNRRTRAAQELYDYLTNQKPDARIILLGDYNDETNVSIYNSEVSPYKLFVDDSAHYSVLTYTLSEQDETSETNYTSVIDNIIISDEMVQYYQKESVGVFIPTDDFIPSYGSSTSDHYPVWAKFDLTQ